MEIKKGKWKHFKGGVYSVIGLGKHSETMEEFVVYEHDGQIWLRPKKMFLETIEKEGKTMPRFKYLGE
jgi:cyclomaltodextrinase / maltogenic alpha-amylase / neopullulanase